MKNRIDEVCFWSGRIAPKAMRECLDLPYAAATCIVGGDLFEPVGQFVDLLFDGTPLIPENVDQVTHHRRQRVVCVLKDISHRDLELRRFFRKHRAAFQEEGSYLVDDCRTPGHKPVTNPVCLLEARQNAEVIQASSRDACDMAESSSTCKVCQIITKRQRYCKQRHLV